MDEKVLSGLEPRAVFHWFEELCAIPHGSRNTERISAFCAAFAKARGLRHRRDEAGNVVIWKDASPGYENHPPVILQGHLDMVCEKDPGCGIDFKKDGLRLAVDGDRIYAEGTTLGGDDGIAIAYALAVLDSDTLRHPPLEALFTVDEEIGLLGASALDASDLKGRVLLNIDSEEEGVLTVGCAGGATVTLTLPLRHAPASGKEYRLEVAGLLGGHSGAEIHKGRGNANKLLGEALTVFDGAARLRLTALSGGTKDNAIPRASEARFTAPPEMEETFTGLAGALTDELRERFPNEPEAAVRCAALGDASTAWDRETTRRALLLLRELPCGVQAMSRDIPGLVETSLNLGILRSGEETLEYVFSVRSSSGGDHVFLRKCLEDHAARAGASYKEEGIYPAWEFKRDSKLRELMARVYEEQYGEKPKIETIHAGLECGILSGKLPGLDCVSFGPDMSGVHTSNESLSIASTGRVWKYLTTVLERL